MRTAIYVLLSIGASIAVTTLQQPPEPSWTMNGKVISVHDGDTVTIRTTTDYRVRLVDCWAPEVKVDNRLPESKQAAEKAAGIKSRDALAVLCLNKPVVLQIPIQQDILRSTTMGRVLGRVWLEGDPESLNEKQVKSGNATKIKREELK